MANPPRGNWIRFFEGDPQKIPEAEEHNDYRDPAQKTDADGIAVFHVSPPLPKVVFPSFVPAAAIDSCMVMLRIPLAEVMARGFAVTWDRQFGPLCKGNPDILEKIRPVPGEILIFVRKLGFHWPFS